MWWVMLAAPRPRPQPREGGKSASKSTYMHIQETRHDTTKMRRDKTPRRDKTHTRQAQQDKHSKTQAQQVTHNMTGTQHGTPPHSNRSRVFAPGLPLRDFTSPVCGLLRLPGLCGLPTPRSSSRLNLHPATAGSSGSGLSSLMTRDITAVAAGKQRHSGNATRKG